MNQTPSSNHGGSMLTTNNVAAQGAYEDVPNSRPQSPTTYRAMTSSSPSARLSPGRSYASAVARSLSPRNSNENDQPCAATVYPSLSGKCNEQQPSSCHYVQPGGRLDRCLSQEKGKAVAGAIGRRGSNTPRPDEVRRVVLEDQVVEAEDPGSASRKRRRTEEDLGNEDSPSVETRTQNAPVRLPTSETSQPPTASSEPAASSSRVPHPVQSNEPSSSRPHNSVVDSSLDIGFAIVPDSDVVESLLAIPDHSSPHTPLHVPASGRRHSGRAARASIDTSDDDDQSDIGDLLPLFPLPPSSIPTSSPRTPAPHRHQRQATPIAPARGHRWSVVSTSSIDDDGSWRSSQRTPSIQEVEMADATRPDTPIPTSSSHSRRRIRRRLLRRERREHRAASVASTSQTSADDGPDEPPITFDVDALDPDYVAPLSRSWRRVQGDSASWRGRGMAAAQRESWNELDDTESVLAVQIPFHGTEEPGVSMRIELMLEVFRRVLLIPGAFILPGYSVAGFHGMNTEPFWYLARGIPLPTIVALVGLGWLNSTPITLNFDFWRDSNPHLCGMFRFIYRFGAQTKAEYENLVRRALLESDLFDTTYDVLTRDISRGGMWRGSTRIDALNAILDSIDVDIIHCRVSANTTEPVAVIYVMPPTSDRRDWLRFSSQLKRHHFGSNIAGHPEPFTSRVWCGYCHSLGHIAGACSVRRTIGWHEPPLQTQQQAQPPQNNGANGAIGRGRGRGNGRGNGRGRGGNGRGRGNF
ncbi:uncharacterized protein C8Q71DRAFT_862175 [Rhodofomes roseus]|uniref:Uncharacterized protein n=1 Tax=Rhodofomes roseus TaxID=34475 RepID=A0ABQ8K2G3_9APHY|nr:uncharacterized protein C8Q71DRAFT_862175 [Rhodofomes roseus]KAH9830719.1 hypothetical protein C8Q71DRAFT_862175 [Rhodofomes roseus]